MTDPFDGAIIDWADERYRPTPAQRRALTHRDHTCRTPGCNRPAVWCEPDHTVEWQHGGTTDLNNLALLCKRCHPLKSLGILTMEQLPNGTLLVSTLWDTIRKSTPEAAWATPMGAVEYLAKAAEADVEGSFGGKDASRSGDEANAGEESWDPWDGPAPQPDPEAFDRSNAKLCAWAAKNLEWPVADPNEDLAALRRRDQAERTREYLEARRQVDIDSYESLGGKDHSWLMAELYLSDHAPEEDPAKPHRRIARRENPSRPRVRAMRKRRHAPGNRTPRNHRATARGTATRLTAERVAPPRTTTHHPSDMARRRGPRGVQLHG